jgi:hypothetical protein
LPAIGRIDKMPQISSVAIDPGTDVHLPLSVFVYTANDLKHEDSRNRESEDPRTTKDHLVVQKAWRDVKNNRNFGTGNRLAHASADG